MAFDDWVVNDRTKDQEGYITNTKMGKDEVIALYKNLWKIEKAFRISKTDLRIRPIYHRLKHRIEAHICIAFCAYKIYKELGGQGEIQNAVAAEHRPHRAFHARRAVQDFGRRN